MLADLEINFRITFVMLKLAPKYSLGKRLERRGDNRRSRVTSYLLMVIS